MNYKIVKSFLDRHRKINYIQRCTRYINNKDFVDYVLENRGNPLFIEFECLGNFNKDKNIFIFENNDSLSGFFAIYRFMLNALYFADRFHFLPVVNYTSKFLYAENININGTINPFEYYFDQVSDIKLSEAYSSYNVVKYKTKYNNLAEKLKVDGGYTTSEDYINSMADITKKYIRLNKYVKPIIDKNINDILKGKSTIGVHYRGTDFKLNFNRHPVHATLPDYIKYVEDACENYKFEQIFLATDDSKALELFKNTFGSKLVYYIDVTRSDKNISVAFSNSDRDQHKYLLGLEVLRDMLTLARCDGLISGLSQVSICARITKVSYDKSYKYLKVIDKGINNNFKNFSNYQNSHFNNDKRNEL